MLGAAVLPGSRRFQEGAGQPGALEAPRGEGEAWGPRLQRSGPGGGDKGGSGLGAPAMPRPAEGKGEEPGGQPLPPPAPIRVHKLPPAVPPRLQHRGRTHHPDSLSLPEATVSRAAAEAGVFTI